MNLNVSPVSAPAAGLPKPPFHSNRHSHQAQVAARVYLHRSLWEQNRRRLRSDTADVDVHQATAPSGPKGKRPWPGFEHRGARVADAMQGSPGDIPVALLRRGLNTFK